MRERRREREQQADAAKWTLIALQKEKERDGGRQTEHVDS